jgi:hypothetical protein
MPTTRTDLPDGGSVQCHDDGSLTVRDGAGPRHQQRGRPMNETSKIRSWARANGYPVGDRGRISSEIRDRFYAEADGNTPVRERPRHTVTVRKSRTDVKARCEKPKCVWSCVNKATAAGERDVRAQALWHEQHAR